MQKSLLIKTRDPKISFGFGGHCNLRALFCSSNGMKLPFPDVFDELLFLYTSSFLSKSVSSSHHRTNTHNVAKSNQFKADTKSRAGGRCGRPVRLPQCGPRKILAILNSEKLNTLLSWLCNNER